MTESVDVGGTKGLPTFKPGEALDHLIRRSVLYWAFLHRQDGHPERPPLIELLWIHIRVLGQVNCTHQTEASTLGGDPERIRERWAGKGIVVAYELAAIVSQCRVLATTMEGRFLMTALLPIQLRQRKVSTQILNVKPLALKPIDVLREPVSWLSCCVVAA